MLDGTDFESWQQWIRLYCLGKDNGENIMKSITEGEAQLGPECDRVFIDLSADEKEMYKADIRATNILLQGIPKDIYTLINHYTDAKDIWDNVKIILGGSKLIKDDRESQLYDEFEHFFQIKEKPFAYTIGLKESNFDQSYAYLKQHEVHANENRMMMERFIQLTHDPLALVSNASIQQYNANNQGRPFQRNNARGVVGTGNARGQNRVGNMNPSQDGGSKQKETGYLQTTIRKCSRVEEKETDPHKIIRRCSGVDSTDTIIIARRPRFQPVKYLDKQQERQYMRLIHRTLQTYQRENIPIITYTLHFGIHNQKSAYRAKNWIKHVTSNTCLKELCLAIVLDITSFTLPDEIFSCEKLNTLSLKFDDTMDDLLTMSKRNSEHALHMKTELFRKKNFRISSNLVITCANLRVLELVDVHISEEVHIKMEIKMEMPCSSRVKFITACSYLTDTYVEIKKVQVKVSMLPQTLISTSSSACTKVGESMSRVQAWKEVVDKVKSRLSKWKMKTLAIGGRLTLLKSVLGPMPLFHMSIFRVPLSVLRMLESIRSHFFNGHELRSNKLHRKRPYGRKLLRSFTVKMGRWERTQTLEFGSCWMNIVIEIKILRRQGVNVLDFMRLKLGNRDMTAFWDDNWIGGVNVLTWKVKIDALPTRLNISWRGIDIDTLSCPICDCRVESSNHLFFSCILARQIARKISLWWNVNYVEVNSYVEWLNWLVSLWLSAKLKVMIEGVFYAMWWYLWSYRNKLLFETKVSLKAVIFDDVVSSLFYWCRVTSLRGRLLDIRKRLGHPMYGMTYGIELEIMRVHVEDEKVMHATSILGCLILNSPFSYLGTKIGGSMSRVQAWKEVVDKKTSLWAKVIKAIHGEDRKVGKDTNTGVWSCWTNIVIEIKILMRQGVNVLDFMRLKLGNRDMTAFWDDNWIDGGVINDLYPRIYALETCKTVNISTKLNDSSLDNSFRRRARGGVEHAQYDALSDLLNAVTLVPMANRWVWSLESSGEFSVASIRKVIDEERLSIVNSMTQWVKYVPIKQTMATSSSGLTFKLHPLVIVNISDHHTRVKAQSQLPPDTCHQDNNNSSSSSSVANNTNRVFGCVIGVQRGRTVEIFNSFELLYDPVTNSLDRAFLENKQELYKKVFPNFYILGWYSTGADAEESDMQIHKALMDINESPVVVISMWIIR
nr:COP9 signalosome complex subunit 6a-like [Tanacetum cinerariifolium]